MIYADATTSFAKITPPSGTSETKFLKYITDGSGDLSSIGWDSVSSTTIVTANVDEEDTDHGLIFVSDSGTGAQTLKKEWGTLKYKPSSGTLTASNVITSDTSTDARNGVANTTSTHTLSVGTVVSIQETSTGDVIIDRGNGYNEGNLYVGKVLTVPRGGKIVADTINVTSLNVKESMVVAERPVRSIAI